LARAKRKYYEGIEISDFGAEGKAIARINNMVTFVSHAAPGDIVDLEVTKKRSNYLEARVTRFQKYSDSRVQPVCKHFGICGGCKWQHIPYHLQLSFKQQQVEDSLRRIGRIANPDISPILGSEKPYFYRNKLEFAFSGRRWYTSEEIRSGRKFDESGGLGFHLPGQFDKVINIEECWLQPEPSNTIRNEIRDFASRHNLGFFNTRNHAGLLRNLIIRTSSTGEVMVILSFYSDDRKQQLLVLEHLKKKFREISSLVYVVNKKGNDTLHDQEMMVYAGKDHITEKFEDIEFRIGPKSFFQTNSSQSLELYRIVRSFADLTGKETVYDLYTGTGTIANFIARNAGKVIGIESVPEAVGDARLNAELNRIGNTIFITGDIRDSFTTEFVEEHGHPDVVITDPPRSGMHRKVLENLNTILPGKIVYVSCNPATQARDLEILSSRYTVLKVQPFDMFPQTHHVENVVMLARK
jgi:23S rRNA (uracil1939-C5)-methyltransferase